MGWKEFQQFSSGLQQFHSLFKSLKYRSPMMVDWARYWRETSTFAEYKLEECINKMNINLDFSYYYDNAIKFYRFLEKHMDYV